METLDQATKSGRSRRGRVVGLGLVAGLAATLLAACNESEPVGNVAAGPAAGAATVVVADDMKFNPASLTAEAGEEITVQVTNEDDMAHDFAIESLDLNTGTIEPGAVATATFALGENGAEFVCTFHPDMKGRIEIE